MEDLYAALDNKGKNPFKKAIMGDIFGSNEEMNKNSLLGMMYNSRIQESELDHLKRIGKDGGIDLGKTEQKKGEMSRNQRLYLRTAVTRRRRSWTFSTRNSNWL